MSDIWRPVIGFDLYEVSTHGFVRNIKTKQILAGVDNGFGRLCVGLRRAGKTHRRQIHRLVAIAFIPNPNHYKLVRHLNDNTFDNHINNLAWGDTLDNRMDAKRNGIIQRGTPKPVKILETQQTFNSVIDCATYLGVTPEYISGVLSGRFKSAKGYKIQYLN